MVHDLRIAGDAAEVLLGCALVFGSALSLSPLPDGQWGSGRAARQARVTAWASTVACALCIAQFLLSRPFEPEIAMAGLRPVDRHGGVVDSAAGVAGVRGDPSHRCRDGGAGRHFRPGDYDVSWLALLEESIGAAQLLGAALVIVGVLVMSRRG